MILTDEQIKSLIINPEHRPDIDAARKLQDEHKVHVTGEGYNDALKRTIGKERAIQFGQDRELSKPVTMFLTKKIKDELSRWKNTQGTRKTYDFGDSKELVESFHKLLLSVWKNSSIENFAYWLDDALYTDFNGFAMVEMPRKEGDVEIKDGIPTKPTGDPYVIFKSIEQVHDFKCSGRRVEYLILNFGFTTETDAGVTKEYPLYRVIDDRADYIYILKGEPQLYEKAEVLSNDIGYVPAIQIGAVLNSTLNDYVKTSHIYQTLPMLNDYMTRHAEHVSSEVLHAYPILAIKGTKCNYVSEKGTACSKGKIFENGQESNCPKCNGTGAIVARNSGEVIIIPELDKQGKAYDPGTVGEYITPPTDILEHQSSELKILEENIIYSGTGIAKALAKSSIQTATEIVLNIKPLEDKISSVLDNIEAIEKFITDAIGLMKYGNRYKGCEIYYGRRLNIRDENLILKEIEDSKRAGMPVSHIRTLLQELIATRNRNSVADMERGFMLLDLEPCATLSVDETQKSEYISDELKVYKLNFDDYIDRFELEHGSIMLYKAGVDYQSRIRAIKTILDAYNNETYLEYESESNQDRNDQREGIPSGDDI